MVGCKTMNPIALSHISSYIPSKKIDIPEVARMINAVDYPFSKSDIDRFDSNLGFKCVPIEEKLSLEEMLYKACTPTICKLQKEGKAIDRIILTRTSQIYWHEQNIFRKLMHDYDLLDIPTFSVAQQNCASIHTSLLLAQQLLNSNEEMEGILLVSGDKAFHPSLRRIPDSLLGDSASCCYLSKNLKGNHHTIQIIKNNVDAVTYNGVNSTPNQLEWFNTTYYFAIRQIVREVLKEANLTLEQISLIIGSNANYKTWLKVSEILDFPIEKFYTDTIDKVGHLYCSDILFNLQMIDIEKKIKPGSYYLTITVGLGGTYGCALHQYL
ncbi:hypothetical protein EXW28_29435 (plasmid) [Bacillus mycoides]|uniref:Beta-ketoacyl-[acyl-carrier-protein] synthase III C-terminal domain-containing protein n=3 Tax=Bacillaceae TaxID=186817 RepID=A0A243ALR6_BACTU|nr:hypothetical protein [Bacillus cereus]OTY26771.1 hypothetical protein BK732_05360 [Bacillus thuringiensis serovar navarrensis]QEL88344.1 hypothetical protein DN409_29150 [Bacillus mycoides]MBE7122132.1 hypothetical protein [Bacillus cereus]QWG53856.1 hypothetical protein EXW37_29430 [Bacillus mycoides]